MDKTVKKLLTGGQKLDFSLRMDLDGEFVVERNYTKNAICFKGELQWEKVCFLRFYMKALRKT